ncbi:MAG: flagellar basal body rod protein FlgB [Methylohalobius sp.]|nr:flagellar basal body rod protein FlgB [Methylohalobius sp.]
MKISFANALSLHPQALALRARRTEVLASNLANADTPNYKARDFEVERLLHEAEPPALPLRLTHASHLAWTAEPLSDNLRYRVPYQASLDGNTVEEHIEQAKFAENALRYQASLEFVNGKFASLLLALRGE